MILIIHFDRMIVYEIWHHTITYIICFVSFAKSKITCIMFWIVMICCGIAHNNMIDCNCKTRGFIYLAKLLTYTQWDVNSTQHTINLFFANDTKKNMCKCIIMAWLWYDFYHSDTTAFYDCLCCHQPIKRLLSTFLH